MADETHMDVSRFSRGGETESKVKMDSGFRRNDGGGGFRQNDGNRIRIPIALSSPQPKTKTP